MKVKIYLLIHSLGCHVNTAWVSGRGLVCGEDPNLEQVIRQVLGRPMDPSLPELGITRPGWPEQEDPQSGERNPGNLRSLCLDDNRLTDVSPLAELTKLETLTSGQSDRDPLALGRLNAPGLDRCGITGWQTPRPGPSHQPGGPEPQGSRVEHLLPLPAQTLQY